MIGYFRDSYPKYRGLTGQESWQYQSWFLHASNFMF